MPEIYRGVNGVNKLITQQFRGVSGVNRDIREQYRGVSGVNRLIFKKFEKEVTLIEDKIKQQ